MSRRSACVAKGGPHAIPKVDTRHISYSPPSYNCFCKILMFLTFITFLLTLTLSLSPPTTTTHHPTPAMRFRTLEIRWHDSKPISTCDFQPVPFKRARPPAGNDDRFAGHSYRLATGGEDNHVRVGPTFFFVLVFSAQFWRRRFQIFFRSGWSIPIFDLHLWSRTTRTPPRRVLPE